ncbi:AEC family transporter [Plastorhodobacter daqingensis]|uniref:AEC family transporter n=1 Tax=Plastorhodobacter daqingensis TaxID=1387281 RepID=A0ABW2UKA2_9RHOB
MLSTVFLALVPIALLIALGHILRRHGFLPASFWPEAERLSYFILLPALFAHGLGTADLGTVPLGSLVVALILPILGVAVLLVVAQRLIGFDGRAFTSVFQGGIRFNNYVGISAAAALFGPSAVGLAAVANATIVPTVNVLSVLAFAAYGEGRASVRGVMRGIATNPLILGCAAGLVLQTAGIALPPGIDGTLRALGQAALPLGLLCVGAALDWSALGRGKGPTLVASGAKFVILPLATVVTCLWLGLSGTTAMVAVLFQSLPTASSSYVMARQLGGDAALMAGIIAFQTLAAAVLLPLALIGAKILFT